MTSFIQIESVWRQRSEGKDPIAFSFPSPLFAVPVNLLYPHHFQIFHGVVWLAEVGHSWLFCLPRPDVGAVSIHPGVQGILRLSNILQNTLLPCYKIDQIFVLHVLLLLMLYHLPVIWLLNVLHVCYFLAAFTPFVVASDVISSSCNLASKCAARLLFLGSIYTVCCCICCCRCRLGGLVWSGSSGQGGPSNSSTV